MATTTEGVRRPPLPQAPPRYDQADMSRLRRLLAQFMSETDSRIQQLAAAIKELEDA